MSPHPPRPPSLTKADLAAFHALLAKAAERRVWARVGKWVVRAVGAVLLAVIAWGLNHLSIQRNDETRHMHSQETARVEKKLDKVEEVTKTLAPEAFVSSKMAK